MGTHPIFESDFDCLTDERVATNAYKKGGKDSVSKIENMVKVIPTKKREILSNYEVFQFVSRHQEEEKAKTKGKRTINNKADEGLNTVTLEIFNYLKKQSASKQTEEMMKTFAKKMIEDQDGKKLTNAEIMQFINLRPVSAAEVSVIVQDIEERIDEDSVDRLAEMAADLLPQA